MRRLLSLLLLLVALPASAGLLDNRPNPTLGGALNNSRDFLPVREAFRLDLIERSPTAIKLQFIAADGYYLYRHRFQFHSDPADITLGAAQMPAGLEKTDEYFGKVEVYHGVLDVELPLDSAEQRPFTLQVTYQGCADKGLCYPPETQSFTIPAAEQGDSDSTSAVATTTGTTRTWSWRELALFFLAGLGLTFTPCVLPMLPILSGVVLRGQVGGMRGFSLSLAYVLSMAACFALLGALMGVFGAELNLQARLQSPWVLVPFALFFAGFALAMFGLYELRLPRFISDRLDRLAGNTRGGSLWGAALLGVLSSLLLSPCVSAPLAGALLYISSSGDALGGGLKLFVLGLGMGAPMVLFATGGGALLPKSGNWMVSVRNTFGVLLLAVAIWLLDRVLPAPLTLALWGVLAAGVALYLGALEFTVKTHRQKFAQLGGLILLVYALASWIGALQGQSDPLRPLGTIASNTSTAPTASAHSSWQTIRTAAELKQALANAKAAQQPLLLDWYADWCISCKVIEREVLNNAEVISALAGYQLIRFDMSASTPEQRALLDSYQLFGPPALLFFAASGDEQHDLRVIGEINASDFAARVRRANAAN
ncbi:MAG: protein-disulfide reductase DsbD [Pseudomonadaceae bacterium]|nr:protein-disulfide reductase DsbD [Pseudomonadaceae bacterium]